MDINNEPRLLASTVLARVEKNKAYANIAFDAVATRGRIPGKVKNLGKELLFGVLRNKSRLETIVSRYVKVPLKKSHPMVRYQLMIAVYQLLYLDNIPDGYVVDRAVEIVKLSLGGSPAKFVNAVLRQILRDTPFPPEEGLTELETIETEYSYPRFLAETIVASAPRGEAISLAAALNQRSRTILRANTLKNTRSELMERLAELVPAAEILPTEFSPVGVEMLGFGDPIRQQPHRDGYYLIQDASSQLVAPFVSPPPGARVLDACAGTGGKSLHMAALMDNQGSILSVDLKQSKMDALLQRARRVGTEIIHTQAMDLAKGRPEGRFSHILLDAPCSGMGVFRRHPEAKWRLSEQEIHGVTELQSRLLDAMVPLLDEGGMLTYVVCTFNKDETKEQVAAFLQRHPTFTIAPPPQSDDIDWAALTDEDGCLALWPHRHDGDGFFAARLTKR